MVGSFVGGGYLHALVVRALVVGVVLGRFVGGYLYALELVLFERLYKFYLYKQLKI